MQCRTHFAHDCVLSFAVQGWLRDVEKGGAQREMENFEVALDGKIVAREPNGDVIQMEVPGWQVLG
jgi:hypothetical protein